MGYEGGDLLLTGLEEKLLLERRCRRVYDLFSSTDGRCLANIRSLPRPVCALEVAGPQDALYKSTSYLFTLPFIRSRNNSRPKTARWCYFVTACLLWSTQQISFSC